MPVRCFSMLNWKLRNLGVCVFMTICGGADRSRFLQSLAVLQQWDKHWCCDWYQGEVNELVNCSSRIVLNDRTRRDIIGIGCCTTTARKTPTRYLSEPPSSSTCSVWQRLHRYQDISFKFEYVYVQPIIALASTHPTKEEETAPKIDPRSTLHSSDGFRFHGATRASQIRKCF